MYITGDESQDIEEVMPTHELDHVDNPLNERISNGYWIGNTHIEPNRDTYINRRANSNVIKKYLDRGYREILVNKENDKRRILKLRENIKQAFKWPKNKLRDLYIRLQISLIRRINHESK